MSISKHNRRRSHQVLHAVTTIAIAICGALLFAVCEGGSTIALLGIDTRGPALAVRVDQIESNRDSDKTEYSFLVTNPNLEAVRVNLTLDLDVENAEYFADGESIEPGIPTDDNDATHFGFLLTKSGRDGDARKVRISFTEGESASVNRLRSHTVTLKTRDKRGNARSGSAVAVFKPDLTISEAPVPTANRVQQSGRFVLSVLAENKGHVATVERFRITYYVSSSKKLGDFTGPTDTPLTTQTIATLNSAQKQEYSVVLNASQEVGVYYYGACISGYSDEVSKANNCSPLMQIEVSETAIASTTPDFIIQSLSLKSGATSALLSPGANFNLKTTVRNHGSASGSGTLWYLRSNVKSVSTFHPREGVQAVDDLESETTSDEYSLTITAPQVGGVYHYGVCAVRVLGEVEIGDNCSSTVVSITVNAPRIRLTLDNSSLTGRIGKEFTVNANIQNIGTAALPSGAKLLIKRSDNSAIGPGDPLDDPDSTPESLDMLEATGAVKKIIALPKRTAAGTYYFGVCVEYTPPSAASSMVVCSSGVTVVITNPFIGGVWSGSNSGASVTNSYTATAFMTSFTAPVIGSRSYSCSIEYDFATYRISGCTGDRTYIGDIEGTSHYRLNGLNEVTVSANGRTTVFSRSSSK